MPSAKANFRLAQMVLVKAKWSKPIASAMGMQREVWIERQKRDREERIDLLQDASALKTGMMVVISGAEI